MPLMEEMQQPGSMGATPQPVESPPAPTIPNSGERGGEVDPKQIELFLDKCWIIAYGGDSPDGEMNSSVLNMLRSGENKDQAGDPVQALADVAASIAGRVISDAVDQKYGLDPAAAFMGMMELVGELGEDAKAEGVYEYSQEDINSAAVRSGETLYKQVQSTGFFDEGKMGQDVDEIIAGSQSGELDSGIAEMSGQAAPQGGADVGGMV